MRLTYLDPEPEPDARQQPAPGASLTYLDPEPEPQRASLSGASLTYLDPEPEPDARRQSSAGASFTYLDPEPEAPAARPTERPENALQGSDVAPPAPPRRDEAGAQDGEQYAAWDPWMLVKAASQSAADKPAMMLKGATAFTPGDTDSDWLPPGKVLDPVLRSSAAALQALKSDKVSKDVAQALQGKLWPSEKDTPWWRVDPRLVPEAINTWSAVVGDYVPLMAMTWAGRLAGKYGGKAAGVGIGAAGAMATGGLDPTDPAQVALLQAVSSKVGEHLGGAAPLVGIEAGSFLDRAEEVGIDKDIAEKYARRYGVSSGVVEYVQTLWNLAAYKRIPNSAKQGALKTILKEVGGDLWEGGEEITQQSLENWMLGQAIEDQRERNPEFAAEKPKLFAGGMRAGATGAGIAALTRMPGHAINRLSGRGQQSPTTPPPRKGRRRTPTTPLQVESTADVQMGADTEIFGTRGQVYPAKYAVVPRAALQASHDPVSFAQNPEYPLTNARDYANPAEQEKVLDVRNGFSAARHVTDSPDAAVGPVMAARIIDEDGNATLAVLGGNNRAMATATLNPARKQELATYTSDRAERFGVPAVPDAEHELIRFMGEFDMRKPGERERVQQIVDALNPSPGKVQNVAEMAAVDAGANIPVGDLAGLDMNMPAADAQAFMAGQIREGRLDRNLRSQIAENPGQAQDYTRRLMVNAAYRARDIADYHATSDRGGVAGRGLVEAAVPALLEMRARGQHELADSFSRGMGIIVEYMQGDGSLTKALDRAARQMEADPAFAIVNDVAAALADQVATSEKTGRVLAEDTAANMTTFWQGIRRAMENWTPEADMFGDARTPQDAIRGALESAEREAQSRAEWDAALQEQRKQHAGLDIVTVESADQLPVGVRKKIGDGPVEAVYDGDRVYIVRSAVPAARLGEVVRHEGGHQGLRELIADKAERTAFLDDVFRNTADRDAWQARLERLGYDIDTSTAEGRAEMADEVLAHLAEMDRPAMWQRALAAIRRSLRRAGLKLQFTENDLRAIANQALDRVRTKAQTVRDMQDARAKRPELEALQERLSAVPPKADGSVDMEARQAALDAWKAKNPEAAEEAVKAFGVVENDYELGENEYFHGASSGKIERGDAYYGATYLSQDRDIAEGYGDLYVVKLSPAATVLELGTSDSTEFIRKLYEAFPRHPLFEGPFSARENVDSMNERSGENLTSEILDEAERIVDDMDFNTLGGMFDQEEAVSIVREMGHAAVSDGRNVMLLTDSAMANTFKVLDEDTPSPLTLTPDGTLAGIVGGEDADIRAKRGEREPDTAPDGTKTRRFAERAAQAPYIRREGDAILASPRDQYVPQSYAEINTQMAQMTDAQLRERMDQLKSSGVPIASEQNWSVLAGLELVNRKAQRGEPVLPLIENLAEKGTTIAQLLRQYGELKTKYPQGLLAVIEAEIKKHGRRLKDLDRVHIRNLIEKDFAMRDKLRAAEDRLRAEPTMENAKAVDQLRAEAERENRHMLRAVRDVMPRTWADLITTALQGNLLVPMSQIANVVGNATFLPLRFAGQGIAAALDTLETMLTKQPRTVLSPTVGMKARMRGTGQGIVQASKQMVTGMPPGELTHGEAISGFRPGRAAIQAWTGKGLPVDKTGKVPKRDRVKKLAEALLGTTVEPMLRALAFGDLPFIQGARAKLLAEQAKLTRVSGPQAEAFVRLPPTDVAALVEREARESVYQQQNRAASVVYQLFKVLRETPWVGPMLEVGARTVVPYVKTPVNLAWEGLQYAAPEISWTRAAYYASKGQRRQANMAVGKAIVGHMMLLTAYYLYKHGLLQGDPDKDKKQRALQYAVLAPNTLNLSGLKRKTAGEDPAWREGDTLINYTKLGFLGIVLNIVANREDRRKMEAAREQRAYTSSAADYFAMTLSATPQLASATLNMTMLKGTSTLLQAIQEERYDYWLRSMFQAVTTIPLPNTLDAVNRARQVYIPEMRGDDNAETFANVVKAKLMQTDGLPLKRDLFGRPVRRTPEGANPWVYNFIDITKTRRIPNDPLMREVYDVHAATRNMDAIPSIPSRTITVRGKPFELANAEYDRFQELIGTARANIVQQLLARPEYTVLPPAARLDILQRAYSRGHDQGKAQFMAERQSAILQVLSGAGRQ